MKGKLIIGVLALSSFAQSAFAAQPYIGVEAIQTYQAFSSGFGKNVFSTSVQDYNAFIGSRFTENFGVEAGYEFQPHKSRDSILVAGQQLPGLTPLIGTEFDGVSSSYRASHPYLGLFAECATDVKIGRSGKLVFQALVGASFSQVKATVTRKVSDAGIITPNIVNTFSERKTVPMVKLSVATNLTKNLGIRLSLNYRNMSRFKIVSNLPSNGNVLNLKMHDAFGVGLGLKYSF